MSDIEIQVNPKMRAEAERQVIVRPGEVEHIRVGGHGVVVVCGVARQLPLVAGCAAAGLARIGVGWTGQGAAVVGYVAGVLIMGVAGLLLLRALDLSPVTQWGEPVGQPCPACDEHGLREDRVAVPEANGIVALCTPECGYAEVRPDPDGPAEPRGRRRPRKSRPHAI